MKLINGYAENFGLDPAEVEKKDIYILYEFFALKNLQNKIDIKEWEKND